MCGPPAGGGGGVQRGAPQGVPAGGHAPLCRKRSSSRASLPGADGGEENGEEVFDFLCKKTRGMASEREPYTARRTREE